MKITQTFIIKLACFSLSSFLTFQSSATLAAQLSYDSFYIIGDSLSDVGNLYTLSGETDPPSPPYFDGRFSNGPVWTEYLASDLGVSPARITSPNALTTEDGINVAFGGATAGDINIANPFGTTRFPGLSPQLTLLEEWSNLTGRRLSADSLVSVWAGGNDYLFDLTSDPQIPVANLTEAVATVYALGARTVIVGNLPDLGATPRGRSLSAMQTQELTNQTLEHNALLERSLLQLEASLTGLDVLVLDAFTLFERAIADPTGFGFTNVAQGCLIVGCDDPNRFLFFDGIHPSSAAHRFIAAEARSLLDHPAAAVAVPEPSTIFLLGAGLLGGLALRVRRERGTAP